MLLYIQIIYNLCRSFLLMFYHSIVFLGGQGFKSLPYITSSLDSQHICQISRQSKIKRFPTIKYVQTYILFFIKNKNKNKKVTWFNAIQAYGNQIIKLLV